VVADASASPAGPSKPKGQRMLTWDEPGEWIVDPVKRLKHCAVPMGVDERGAATLMLIVKYEPGSEVGPHFHHSDYASIVVQGSIEVTRRNHEVGSIRVVNAGTVYGPLVAGPEGCTVVEVFATGVPDPSVTAMNTYV
jgi:quercetin dioxygenase-like cupin family protein